MLYIPSVNKMMSLFFSICLFFHLFDKRNCIISQILFVNAVSQFFNGKFLFPISSSNIAVMDVKRPSPIEV